MAETYATLGAGRTRELARAGATRFFRLVAFTNRCEATQQNLKNEIEVRTLLGIRVPAGLHQIIAVNNEQRVGWL